MLVKWAWGLVAAAGALAELDLKASTPLSSAELLAAIPRMELPQSSRFSWKHLAELLTWGGPTDDSSGPSGGDTSLPDTSTPFIKAEHYFYGIGTPQNLSRAAELYRLAADHGDAEAQFMVGLAYSTGLFGNHEKNEALATLYYTISAINGCTRGQVAVGYRYLNGYGMPRDAVQSYNFYLAAANSALDYFEFCDTGLGYRNEPRRDYVAADEHEDGLYGDSSAFYSLRRTGLRSMLDKWNSVQDGVEYLQFHAYTENKAWPLMYLAQAYAIGPEGVPDYPKAVEAAQLLIERTRGETDTDGRWRYAWAHGFLGNCYRRGEGLPYDLAKAREYYEIGLAAAPIDKQDDAPKGELRRCKACYNGLAVLDLAELEQKNLSEVEYAAAYEPIRELFLCGSLLGHSNSGYMMGRDLYTRQFFDEAVPLLKSASSALPQPHYLLADIYNAWSTMAPSAADRRDWQVKAAQHLHNMFEHVQDFYSPMRFAQAAASASSTSPKGPALAAYLVCAELGITSAQVNLADLLDVQHSWLSSNRTAQWPLPSFVQPSERAPLALRYFSLAGQGHERHSDSLNKVAEYHFSGHGTEANPRMAASIYQALTRETRHPLAFWSLGWMHEHGKGMIQDFHLAKRYYDSSLYYAPHSYIAVQLSLVGLYLRSFFARILGSGVQQIQARKTSYEGKSWWQSFWELKQHLDLVRRQYWIDDEEEVAADVDIDDFYGPMMVDLAILVSVLAIIVSIIWARRRRA